jgi:hypothetical protein
MYENGTDLYARRIVLVRNKMLDDTSRNPTLTHLDRPLPDTEHTDLTENLFAAKFVEVRFVAHFPNGLISSKYPCRFLAD